MCHSEYSAATSFVESLKYLETRCHKEIEIIKTQTCRVLGFLHCVDGSLIKWKELLPNRPAVSAVLQPNTNISLQLRLQSLALHPHTMVMFPLLLCGLNSGASAQTRLWHHSESSGRRCSVQRLRLMPAAL